MLARPTQMEGVERINVVIVNPNQQAEFMPRYNIYTINVNRERNCYSGKGFGITNELLTSCDTYHFEMHHIPLETDW